MIKYFTSYLCCFFLFSCQTNVVKQNSEKARQIYSEGMAILDNRISIQSLNKERAIELNKMAIEKFSNAYRSDTTFKEPVLFASECTMFAKDYQNCIYWTLKLKQLDTSQENQSFCIDRVKYCNKQQQLEKEK
jgi:hypothetical protein